LELEADKRPQSIQAWFKKLDTNWKEEEFRPRDWVLIWTSIGAMATVFGLIVTLLDIPGWIKQNFNHQPIPTVSPQKSPASKP
jgi:hypothetical protein